MEKTTGGYERDGPKGFSSIFGRFTDVEELSRTAYTLQTDKCDVQRKAR